MADWIACSIVTAVVSSEALMGVACQILFKELLSPGCTVWESHFTHCAANQEIDEGLKPEKRRVHSPLHTRVTTYTLVLFLLPAEH